VQSSTVTETTTEAAKLTWSGRGMMVNWLKQEMKATGKPKRVFPHQQMTWGAGNERAKIAITRRRDGLQALEPTAVAA
jgi:hypothetical protein